jgi:type II secretory pathway pseudopilin PulG
MVTNRKRGFTLIELLIFTAVFSFVVVTFITIFVTVINIQGRESSQSEVNGQSQFLLQQVQYYVERASLIDMAQDTPAGTLKVYLGVNSQDPTYLTLSSGTVYLQQTATGSLQALTSPRVTVSSLTFTRHANPPGHDSVGVAFTMAYNTTNPKLIFSQMLQTSIARVSAATFDSNLIPSSTATYNIGVSGQTWSSINQVINFSGANVGIGVTPSLATFEVGSGNIRADTGDVVVASNASGLILKDSSNVCWRLRVATSGVLSTASVGCP